MTTTPHHCYRGRQGRGGDRAAAPPAPSPRHPTGGVQLDGPPPRPHGPRRPGAGHHREALRHRPGLRPGSQRHGARGVRRIAGLPHRPLPGEGVGRQHPRLPVRQRPVRAHLEPGPHPLRADRRPGEPHHRGPGRVLRGHGRVPGHGGHAPVPGARVRRHGAADVARRQAAAGREDQGVRGPAAARRAPRRARSVPGVPQGAGRPSAVRHRDLRGTEGRGRQLAVVRGAVLPPHGEGVGRPTIGHHARAAGADAADVPVGGGGAARRRWGRRRAR